MGRIQAQDPASRRASTTTTCGVRPRPAAVEAVLYFWVSLLHGDLGTSILQFPRPVSSIIMHAVPYTLGAAGAGDPAQLHRRQQGRRDGRAAEDARQHGAAGRLHPRPRRRTCGSRSCSPASSARSRGVFPLSGAYSYDVQPGWTFEFASQLPLALVPAVPLAVPRRLRRLGDRDAEHDHLRARDRLRALPRGARRPAALVRRYAFRNAMLPQITGLALALGAVVAGALVDRGRLHLPGPRLP